MKISKLFHWLYATLMLLPFASVVSTTLYYSFNKNAVIPQVDKEVSKEVEFNQLVINGLPSSTDNWYSLNYGEFSYSDDNFVIVSGGNYSGISQYLNLEPLHKYYLSIELSTDINTNVIQYGLSDNVNYTSVISTSNVPSTFFKYDGIITTPSVVDNNMVFVRGGDNEGLAITFNVRYVNVIDLTLIFGAGNEPTLQEFNTWFTDDYYDYTLSEHIVIPNYDTIQVADNSINHFWLPSFGAIGYNIQSYIGWVIGGIFGLNVVNGIGFVIVRLFTYWLIISICWLIFDVLMYVPNLVHKWLDKAAID